MKTQLTKIYREGVHDIAERSGVIRLGLEPERYQQIKVYKYINKGNRHVVATIIEGHEVRIPTSGECLYNLLGEAPGGDKAEMMMRKWLGRLEEQARRNKATRIEKMRVEAIDTSGWYVGETGNRLWGKSYAIIKAGSWEDLQKAFPGDGIKWERFPNLNRARRAAEGGIVEIETVLEEVADMRATGRVDGGKRREIRVHMENMWAVWAHRNRRRNR